MHGALAKHEPCADRLASGKWGPTALRVRVKRTEFATFSQARCPNTKARVSFVDRSELALQLFDDPRPDVGNNGPERPTRRAEQYAATACSRQSAGCRHTAAGRQGVGDERRPAACNALPR